MGHESKYRGDMSVLEYRAMDKSPKSENTIVFLGQIKIKFLQFETKYRERLRPNKNNIWSNHGDALVAIAELENPNRPQQAIGCAIYDAYKHHGFNAPTYQTMNRLISKMRKESNPPSIQVSPLTNAA